MFFSKAVMLHVFICTKAIPSYIVILCFALPQHCKTYKAARKKKKEKRPRKKVSYTAKCTGNALCLTVRFVKFKDTSYARGPK